jgi:hypothetical protein
MLAAKTETSPSESLPFTVFRLERKAINHVTSRWPDIQIKFVPISILG